MTSRDGEEVSFTNLTAPGASATATGSRDSDSNSTQFTVLQSRHDSHDEDGEGGVGGGDGRELREQDRFLPIANVARIMKNSIPSSQGKIAKDARECVQECVSEFISFITSEASTRCHAEKRKTINGEDILFAMSTLGFDNYVEPLKIYLQKYREVMKGDKQNEGEFDSIGELLGSANITSMTTDQSGNQVVLSYGNTVNVNPQQF